MPSAVRKHTLEHPAQLAEPKAADAHRVENPRCPHAPATRGRPRPARAGLGSLAEATRELADTPTRL
ncbi:hypothetical protein [Rhodococcus sp. SJ-3]|uniref:hypothetical protein n=1 Tax=Rhodococcus sp. SJ-3 TaxID=3454628 RepID=UPI003F7918BB